MKIIFLCGSLEPGKDGVGDYVRHLAIELILQGHQITALALNDNHLTEEVIGVQESKGIDLPVFRVPSIWPSKDRFINAERWINDFDPEWLSLQFVPFSFHKKGLPWGLSKQLGNIGKGRRWHIMFHELWVGMDMDSTRKQIWWGWLQRYLIHSLTLKLKPSIAHTQNKLYQIKLARLGLKADYLPLFSNIPTDNKLIIKLNSERVLLEVKKAITMVVFGSIHPDAPIDQLANEAGLYAKEKCVQIRLIIIGRCGTEQERWAAVWEAAGLKVELLGEQSPESISVVLGNATIGIATTPLALVEKSGSVAAMREHSLPVLCVSRPWQPRGVTGLKPPPGILEYRYGNLETSLVNKSGTIKGSKVSDVSRQLISDLLNSD